MNKIIKSYQDNISCSDMLQQLFGQHLVGQGADLRAKYHAVRSRIKDVLLNL